MRKALYMFSKTMVLVTIILAFFRFEFHPHFMDAGLENTFTEYEERDTLISVNVRGKKGFIDEEGEMVIPPEFNNAGPFSNGLAPARKQGLFGYIDNSGKFALPPVYDFATPFNQERAKVIYKGEKYVINPKGEFVFSLDSLGAKDIESFQNQRAKIRTHGKHEGFVDRFGKMVIDTIFTKIHKFNYGVAVASMDTFINGKKTVVEGLIDTSGKRLTPFGLYEEIDAFQGEIIKVEMEGNDPDFGPKYGYIERKGDLLFTLPYKKYWLGKNFLDGYAIIDYIYRVDSTANTLTVEDTVGFKDNGAPIIKEREKKYYSKDYKDQAVVINDKGHVILDSPKYKVIKNVGKGKGLAGDFNDFHLIDFKTGEKLLDEKITDFKGNFEDGLLIAESNQKTGLLNEAGEWIIQPQYQTLQKVKSFDDYYWAKGDSEKYYIIDKFNERLFSFDSLKGYSLHHPYIRIKTAGYSAVVNPLKSEWVWKKSTKRKKTYQKLDYLYRFRGFFYARSFNEGKPSKKERKQYNYPRKIPSGWDSFPGLKLWVDTTTKDTIFGHYKGYKVYLVNNAKDTAVLPVQDNRLYMKMQAKDRKGNWKPIMYLPSSWCGNSYYNVALPPGFFWDFTVPITTGALKTQIRLKLNPDEHSNTVRNRHIEDKMDSTAIYSNTFSARINPVQFFKKQPYQRKGIMDPYYAVNQ